MTLTPLILSMVSLPTPPLMTLSTESPFRLSLPMPPVMFSTVSTVSVVTLLIVPNPRSMIKSCEWLLKSMVSIPSPPWNVSCPSPPINVSSPAPRQRLLSNSPPLRHQYPVIMIQLYCLIQFGYYYYNNLPFHLIRKINK